MYNATWRVTALLFLRDRFGSEFWIHYYLNVFNANSKRNAMMPVVLVACRCPPERIPTYLSSSAHQNTPVLYRLARFEKNELAVGCYLYNRGNLHADCWCALFPVVSYFRCKAGLFTCCMRLLLVPYTAVRSNTWSAVVHVGGTISLLSTVTRIIKFANNRTRTFFLSTFMMCEKQR